MAVVAFAESKPFTICKGCVQIFCRFLSYMVNGMNVMDCRVTFPTLLCVSIYEVKAKISDAHQVVQVKSMSPRLRGSNSADGAIMAR